MDPDNVKDASPELLDMALQVIQLSQVDVTGAAIIAEARKRLQETPPSDERT